MNAMTHEPSQQPIVIECLDPIVHNPGHPFCAGDRECPCRLDPDNINLLLDLVRQEILSVAEAELVMKGAII